MLVFVILGGDDDGDGGGGDDGDGGGGGGRFSLQFVDFSRLELAIETDPYDVAAWEARLREAIQAVGDLGMDGGLFVCQ